MTWNVDTSHSLLEFSVRHMGISTVRGRFREWSGALTTTEDGRPESITVTIETASIDTGNKDRDDHLRSPDFFDAATNPQIRFQSTAIERTDDGTYRVTGDLDMNGVTKPATFEVTPEAEPIRDPYGLLRAAATVKGTINRRDWGLTWSQLLETGAMVVGEKVTFTAEVQIVTQPQEEEAAATA